ncbi:interleukin 17 receptor A2 [Paramuricea clavata]|nr:interleukin 17 receptor A2 [Paramuricea clavata]
MDVYLKMEKWLRDSNNKCDIVYSEPNSFTNPYNVIVDWELDDTGTSGTWGWQIDVLGLDGDAGYQYCVHINSREKLLKWMIKNIRLTPGAKYNITLQTLPKSSRKSNSIFKFIRIPNFPDMCETIGRNCSWEFCFPVENLTVTNHSSSPLVSWNPSPFYKFQHVFEVNYTDENGSDSDRFIVKNGSHFRLTNLKHKYFRKYFVEVRPIFAKGADSNRIYGKRSIKLMFYTAYPPTPTPTKKDDPSNKLKIIIFVCVATVCLGIVFSLLAYLRYHRSTSDDEASRTSEERLIPDQPKNVLLVHDWHCKSCNDATHSLANVFGGTGHIKCSLDLCSTKEIAVAGMGWYEERLKNCEKIVVVCTKESKKTYYENIDGQGSNTNMCKSAFRFVLKMILGQMSSGNDNAIQVFPVCFDHSSNEDIPNFLRDRRYYSLPSDINPLLLSLSGLNARQIGDMAEYRFEDSIELQRKTSQWKNAIQKVEKSHGRAQAGSLINFARSLSSSSADDPCRV